MADLPIAVVIGAGVTGGRVAKLVADSGTARIGISDVRKEVALAVARIVNGAVGVEPDYAEAADVAVLTHPGPHADHAKRLLNNGVAVVSTSDDLDDVRDLIALGDLAGEREVPLVVGAAMSPGLSGLLARLLSNRLAETDEIHVAMHGTGGPACARQHHRALGSGSLGWHEGVWLTKPAGTGRELCWFPEPVNAYDCYRAEMPDPLLLHEVFPDVSRISARMSATRRDRFTARLPMLSPPHKEGGIGAVRVEVRGALASGQRETLIAGVAVRSGLAAAVVAATMTKWALSAHKLNGLILLGDERLDTEALLGEVVRCGVSLHEFTGIARPPTEEEIRLEHLGEQHRVKA